MVTEITPDPRTGPGPVARDATPVATLLLLSLLLRFLADLPGRV